MDVSAAGHSALGALLPLPRISSPPPTHGGPQPGSFTADQALSIIQDLSPADVGRLMKMVEIPASIADTHPEVSHSGLIEPQQMPHQITAITRLDAEVRLGQALQHVAESSPKQLADWDARPETLLLVANRLLDTGGHGNYIRSAQLSQAVIDTYRQPTLVVDPNLSQVRIPEIVGAVEPGGLHSSAASILWTGFRTGIRKGILPRLRTLSVRAPLLVLLLAWLALGVAAGGFSGLLRAIWPDEIPGSLVQAGFDLWGIGFLFLVGLGFYLRVRKITL